MAKPCYIAKKATHIILFVQTEELLDLGSALRSQTLRVHGVGHTGDVVVALLDNRQSQHGQIHRDDASTHTLPLALTGAAGAVARVAVREQEAHTRRVHDTLLHGKTLLVVAAGDLEDVALEFVADAVARDFLAHSSLHEDAQLAVIVDFDQLLRPVGRVGDIKLHLDGEELVDRPGWGDELMSTGYSSAGLS